jgi:LysR family transcriptional regulator, transcriptional activator for aaeXAB operon
VQRLESDLQARLLERSTRRVALTEVGSAFLLHARAMAQAAENAVAEVAAFQGNPRGLLRVAMPATMGRSILAPELPRFLERWPDVDLAVTITDRLLSPVADNFDVVIRAGRLEDSSLIVRRVATIDMGLFASVDYIARHGLPATVAALAGHAVIGALNPGAALALCRGAETADVALTRRFASNDPIIALEMIRAGMAIGQAARWLLRGDIAAGRVVAVLPDWGVADPPALFALYASRIAMPPKLRVFLGFLEDVAGNLQLAGTPHAERP